VCLIANHRLKIDANERMMVRTSKEGRHFTSWNEREKKDIRGMSVEVWAIKKHERRFEVCQNLG